MEEKNKRVIMYTYL